MASIAPGDDAISGEIGKESIVSHSSVDGRASLGYGHSVVVNEIGGKIITDDPGLAAWSVDAMRLVRELMFRCAGGLVPLPFPENWVDLTDEDGNDLIIPPGDVDLSHKVPTWASLPGTPRRGVVDPTADQYSVDQWEAEQDAIVISDLSLMADEVSELLNAMEVMVAIQRQRRLEKLRPPSPLRRNWYIGAAGLPVVVFFLDRLLRKGYGKLIASYIVERISQIYEEHVYNPLSAM